MNPILLNLIIAIFNCFLVSFYVFCVYFLQVGAGGTNWSFGRRKMSKFIKIRAEWHFCNYAVLVKRLGAWKWPELSAQALMCGERRIFLLLSGFLKPKRILNEGGDQYKQEKTLEKTYHLIFQGFWRENNEEKHEGELQGLKIKERVVEQIQSFFFSSLVLSFVIIWDVWIINLDDVFLYYYHELNFN